MFLFYVNNWLPARKINAKEASLFLENRQIILKLSTAIIPIGCWLLIIPAQNYKILKKRRQNTNLIDEMRKINKFCTTKITNIINP